MQSALLLPRIIEKGLASDRVVIDHPALSKRCLSSGIRPLRIPDQIKTRAVYHYRNRDSTTPDQRKGSSQLCRAAKEMVARFYPQMAEVDHRFRLGSLLRELWFELRPSRERVRASLPARGLSSDIRPQPGGLRSFC